jgi:hypothetical protein
VLPPDHSRSVELTFSQARWQGIVSVIPIALDDSKENFLKVRVSKCCNNYLSLVRLQDEGATTAAALRKPAGKQSAPLERLSKHLKAAALTWSEIDGMHDDRLGPLSDLGSQLAAMASDAERRLKKLRSMRPAKPARARTLLIRGLVKCCRDAGLNPSVSGRVYENASPTWFQEFVAALNDNLLGARGWGAPESYTRNALFAEVAKALRGDGK